MAEQWRKKPVVIEAVQWTGDNLEEVTEFAPRAWFGCPDRIAREHVMSGAEIPMSLWVTTLEGDHRAVVGDWIIRGVQGEFYPCKPDIFEATYERAGGVTDGE